MSNGEHSSGQAPLAEDERVEYHWVAPCDGLPSRGIPVLCAWKRGDRWDYAVAKFTGKRWLDPAPTDDEQYFKPHRWRYIEVPT